ncbi:NAD-dependent epimerase/dehydratase family protein [Kovacikia minuta CCNUW1]|uniref:NAD-dependent epimerase/dehydratase family protein n=1 Tax=Kovacikia minuta TaxID=2931930 RepID=UPI001CCACC1C|nr:NAD-dependent epimerase/dehydratase family protein [Kovacikia minuta]UBF25999.1 NAD-dependent epimerase/dehydratase family protein [Kovacikia minuta CCNUW1]
MYFKGKKVLVAGGTGMIGIPLVEMLVEQGAQVRIASLDDPARSHPEAEFHHINLMPFENCLKMCQGMEFVFNLLGVKGSPAVTTTKPASFFVPTITLDTNLMEAARQAGAEGFLFTSSVGVYAPAEVFYEEDVWRTFPSPNDRFAGWAKRMGELQAEAYRVQYGWDRIAIVRPANVYGAYDNFDLENAMVVPSLIKRAMDGENPLTVWGDGSPQRDFIHARDVARGMILAAEKANCEPINLASGVGTSIQQLVHTIIDNLDHKPEVIWDTSKPSGDQKRIMDISRARAIGFEPQISLQDGIRQTMEWYGKHKSVVTSRYDVFA